MRVFSDSDGRICAVLAIRMRRHGRSMLTVPRIFCLLFWVEEATALPHYCCTYPARKRKKPSRRGIVQVAFMCTYIYVDRRKMHTCTLRVSQFLEFVACTYAVS